LTGDIPKDEVLIVSKVSGQASKAPALVNKLFKKRDLVDFVMHEAELIDQSMISKLNMFRSPLSVMLHFSKISGVDLVKNLDGDSASGEQSFDALFALTVASYRDELKDNAVCQLVLDILWGAWSGIYDEEMESLASQDLQGNAKTFLWHRYCSEGSTELGVKFRAMLAASTKGPISMQPLAQIEMAIGASELDDKAKVEVKEVQELLMSLRRKTVNFASLPAIGGAAGGDFSTAQLQKVWESSRVGHKYSHMKTRVRAFVFCADMFPPNLVKPSASGGSLVDQITPDADRMKRVIDFITQKRLKDDIVLLFDGRSRACRKIIENAEEKLAAPGAHQVAECWYVYVMPEKNADPRVPGRQTSFNSNIGQIGSSPRCWVLRKHPGEPFCLGMLAGTGQCFEARYWHPFFLHEAGFCI